VFKRGNPSGESDKDSRAMTKGCGTIKNPSWCLGALVVIGILNKNWAYIAPALGDNPIILFHHEAHEERGRIAKKNKKLRVTFLRLCELRVKN